MSTAELFSKKGAPEFFFTLMNDFYKFDEKQKTRLFDTISENFLLYKDVKLTWVVCDIIARNYDQADALGFFREYYPRAGAPGRDGIALGLDIIAYRHAGEQRIATAVAAILESRK